jgi:hypothetical protein
MAAAIQTTGFPHPVASPLGHERAGWLPDKVNRWKPLVTAIGPLGMWLG